MFVLRVAPVWLATVSIVLESESTAATASFICTTSDLAALPMRKAIAYREERIDNLAEFSDIVQRFGNAGMKRADKSVRTGMGAP